MSLSRDMEFHADAVAASVSGSANCISALGKLEISDPCYGSVIQKANELLAENTKLTNVYDNHSQLLVQYAQQNNLLLENNSPVADEAFFKKNQFNKVNIRDQWASHPPRDERNLHLRQLDVAAVRDPQPAWIIFQDAEKLQQQLTDLLYEKVPGEKLQLTMDAAGFREKYQQDVTSYALPAAYNGYYDDIQAWKLDPETVTTVFEGTISQENFDALFNDEQVTLVKSLAGNEQDEQLLLAITEKRVEVKTFDYDGQKMEKAEAAPLLQRLQQEIAAQKILLQQHEEKILSFFYKAATRCSEETLFSLKEKYKTHIANRRHVESFLEAGQQVMNRFAPLQSGQQLSISDAETIASGLADQSEVLKPLVRSLLNLGVYDNNPDLRGQATLFSKSAYRYFDAPNFLTNELDVLYRVVHETAPLLPPGQHRNFKTILEYQLQIFERAKTSA